MIAARVRALYPGDGMAGEKAEHALPVVGWAVLQLQPDSAGADAGAPLPLAQCNRRLPKLGLDCAIEPAHAAKARRKGDIGDGHRGLRQQLPGKKQALVQGDGLG